MRPILPRLPPAHAEKPREPFPFCRGVMTVLFRFLLIATAALTLLLAAFGIAGQNRDGSAGEASVRVGTRSTVLRVQPNSNAYHSGLRPGDVIDWARVSTADYLAAMLPVAGKKITLDIVRNGESRRVSFAAVEAPDELDRSWIGLLVILGAVAASLLVGLRKPESRDARFLAFFLLASALYEATNWMSAVASTSNAKFAWNLVTNGVFNTWLNYGIIVIATTFPPASSRLRRALRATALPFAIITVVDAVLISAFWITPHAPFGGITVHRLPAITFFDTLVLGVGSTLAAIAGCLAGLATVDDEHRAQMNWVAFAICVTSTAWLVSAAASLIAPGWTMPGHAWLQLFYNVPFLIVLPYVILRHRLVDISVAVSRTAVFAAVSVLVVSAFVLGEWLIGKAADEWLPQSQKGIAGQAVVLAVALVIGLSARSIHALVERRLNALFFARRARALANLRRFALETDVVMKGAALLTMFYDTVAANSEARYVAVYLRDGATFVLARGASSALPAGFDEDDPAIVHLRRWSEPYEHDAGTHPFSEALIVPMTVHGTLFGVLVCGPKRERTHYSSEEIEVLAQAAHRTGIAYVFLSHQSVVGGTPVFTPA